MLPFIRNIFLSMYIYLGYFLWMNNYVLFIPHIIKPLISLI
jgi:hypothetical protein